MSPTYTFDQVAKGPVKHSLWVLPIVLMIVVSIVSNILMKSNPGIQSAIRESSIRALEQQLDKAVQNGSMTASEKEKYVKDVEAKLSHEEPSRFISQSIVISTMLIFNILIASSIFFLVTTYVLGGNGRFIKALIAYTLPMYILMIQSIVSVIISTTTGIQLSGTNLADFLNVHSPTMGGFLLGKIDPFLLWFYSIVGIGYAKMFGSGRMALYITMTLLVWLGSGILVFYAVKAFPALRWIVNI
jgi:hypothetical protein